MLRNWTGRRQITVEMCNYDKMGMNCHECLSNEFKSKKMEAHGSVEVKHSFSPFVERLWKLTRALSGFSTAKVISEQSL